MINYAQFTAEQLEMMAKHGATPELRDRVRAEQTIRQQGQFIFELRKQNAAIVAALEDLLGDGGDIHRGVCMRCGRDYLASEGEFRNGENCDADDCPGFLARTALAAAK